MSNYFNSLMAFGQRPSLGQMVDERRSLNANTNARNLLNDQMQQEMIQKSTLADLYGKYVQGDKSALGQIASVAPDAHMAIQKSQQEQQQLQQAAEAEQNAKLGRMVIWANTEEKWAATPFGQQGIPFEQREAVLGQFVGQEDVFGAVNTIQSDAQKFQLDLDRFAETKRHNRATERNTNLGTQRDRDVYSLMTRGFSRNEAEDVAAGRVRVTSPDQYGNVWLVNVATGERRQTGGGEQPAEVDRSQQTQQPLPSLERDAENAAGPIANVQAGLSGFIGPFVRGRLFENTQDARQRVRLFRQEAKQALVNNDRFPVHEQKVVDQLLPDESRFFNDPDDARANVVELRGFLERKREVNESTLRSGRMTSKRRGEIVDQNAAIDRIISLMGEPGDSANINTADIDSMDEAQLDAFIQRMKNK